MPRHSIAALVVLFSCTMAPNLDARALPSRPEAPLLAPRTASLAHRAVASAPRSSALLEPDCPHLDDALWWDGFALPELGGSVLALGEDGGDLIVGGGFSPAGLRSH